MPPTRILLVDDDELIRSSLDDELCCRVGQQFVSCLSAGPLCSLRATLELHENRSANPAE